MKNINFILLSSLFFVSCQTIETENRWGNSPDSWCIKGEKTIKQPSGHIMYVCDMSDSFPYNRYIGKNIKFKSPCTIHAINFAGGISYELVDGYKVPKNGALIDLFNLPVYEGTLTCVRGTFWYGSKEDYSDGKEVIMSRVDALIKVNSPYLNDGKSIYLPYHFGNHMMIKNNLF